MVGGISPSIPTPRIPRNLPGPAHWIEYVKHGALIGGLITMVAAILFRGISARHGYKISQNKELYALGSAMLLGGILSGAAIGVSASRMFIMQSCGGRTQLTFVFGAFTSLVLLQCCGGLLKYLPVCVVSSILVVSFYRSKIVVKRVRKYYRQELSLFYTWVFTYSIGMLFQLGDGILFGYIFSVLVSALQDVYPRITTRQSSRYNGNKYWVDERRYTNLDKQEDKTVVIAVSGPIYFLNYDIVKKSILSQVKLRYTKSLEFYKNSTISHINNGFNFDESTGHIRTGNDSTKQRTFNCVGNNQTNNDSCFVTLNTSTDILHHVILDMACVPYIDVTALRVLVTLKSSIRKEYNATFSITGCCEVVRGSFSHAPRTLKRLENNIYATVDDAVTSHKIILDMNRTENIKDESDLSDCDVTFF